MIPSAIIETGIISRNFCVTLLEDLLYLYTCKCKSLQMDLEIDVRDGLMAPHMAPGRSELHT